MLKRRRIRKRHIQRKPNSWFYLFPLILVIGIGLFVSVRVFRKDFLITPLPKTGQMRVAQEQVKSQVQKDLENKLNQRKIMFDKIEQDTDGGLSIFLTDNGEVVVTDKKALDLQLDSLQVILTQLTMEGKRFSKLDLRFDKPIIVLKKG